MKQAIARKWVAALRSGDYKQGQGQLRKNDAFCCLGVLCNLHAQEHPYVARDQRAPDWYLGHKGEAPNAVMAWSGLKDACGELNINESLAHFNDTGKTFSEIADIIEAKWRRL